MDNLRGTFDSEDAVGEDQDWDSAEDEENGFESPPHAIGQDERRMQVRAYNHWASLLGDRTYPSIEDLEPHNLDDFGPNSVLLDFSAGIEDPAVQFIGAKLGEECGATDSIEKLSDVPPRSLLSRITDHYMQILANEAPIGFEAEFVNLHGVAILYRGILLPFSSNDETIDFIYGVINWKEIADQVTSDELLLEIDQALDTEEPAEEQDEPHRHHADPVTEWADSPACETQEEPLPETAETAETAETEQSDDPFTAPLVDLPGEEGGDQDDEDAGSNIAAFASDYLSPVEDDDDLPMPDFGQYALEDPEEEEFEDDDDASYSFASLSDYIEAPAKKAIDLDADRFDPGEYQPEYGEDSEEGPSFGDSADDPLSPVDPVEAADLELGDEEAFEAAYEPVEELPTGEPTEEAKPEAVEPEQDAGSWDVSDFEAEEVEASEDADAPEPAEHDIAAEYDIAAETGADPFEVEEVSDETGEPDESEVVDLADFVQPPAIAPLETDFAAFELTEEDMLAEDASHEDAAEAQAVPDAPEEVVAEDVVPEDVVTEEVTGEEIAAEPATPVPDFEPVDPVTFAPVEQADEEAGLYDCLAAARDLAESARTSEDRSRSALYAAVSRAYDVSLAAEEEPDAYAELLEDNGLVVQDRAPMTPVVKLVFGSDYDKTRLTEYATALSHAHRLGIERGRLGSFLSQAEGGLKGVVAAERRMRREEAGLPVEDAEEVRQKLAEKLRELEALAFDDLSAEGAEFSLVMVRRDGSGEVAVIGEIDDDIKLIERAARKLVG